MGDAVEGAAGAVRLPAVVPRLVRLDRVGAEAGLLRAAVVRHRLAPGQSRFTALPVASLPAADADPARVPFAIVVGTAADAAQAREAAAGFGVLDHGSGLRDLVEDPQRAVLLRAYYVTPQWQGRGLGRASCAAPLLDRLIAEAVPHADRAVLCVNVANHAARRVYEAAGYTATGRVIHGDAGPQHVMSRPLATGAHPAPLPRPERTENTL
ncbi:GNAT family N-acetyltransferase [Nocardiopsis flavescens]|uniref:Acetyltransferase (GNAT) family protein n=1 Tax=Nocardiopsis flavescens TaxID=758803 RepID=A0A1M6W0Z1_9ACTN|nr:GNAT family N-acetyltransferase [Nocardiopsis flavescens]SHK87298.1 Acetyltransferase (GNAT) family protein [Nocardiopsis flavescens]